MNFTREPIIETVITPKEGCKLVVRNSKNVGQEEYFVDAIEVVSFGSALFYRSTERPKSFLVPVSDYEVIELKETRLVLKNVSLEKSIKIGGGKDGMKKENFPDENEPKKKDRKRLKHKKSNMQENSERKVEPVGETKEGPAVEEAPVVSSSMVRRLIPPPTQLIKEKLAKIIDEQMVEKDHSLNGEQSPPADAPKSYYHHQHQKHSEPEVKDSEHESRSSAKEENESPKEEKPLEGDVE